MIGLVPTNSYLQVMYSTVRSHRYVLRPYEYGRTIRRKLPVDTKKGNALFFSSFAHIFSLLKGFLFVWSARGQGKTKTPHNFCPPPHKDAIPKHVTENDIYLNESASEITAHLCATCFCFRCLVCVVCVVIVASASIAINTDDNLHDGG